MKISSLRSVRVRMTLWGMAIIALVLGGFGVACLVIVPRALIGSVDRDLETSAAATSQEISESFRNPTVGINKIGSPLDGSNEGLVLPVILVEGREIRSMIVKVDPGSVTARMDKLSLEDQVLLQTGVMQKLNRDEKVFTEVKHNGKRFRALAYSVMGPNASKLMVVSAYSVEELYNLEATLQKLFLMLLPIALGATLIGGLAMTRNVLRPVREINVAASEVDAHDLSRRLPVSGNDEFSELAGTFNGMFDRLQSSFIGLQNSVEQQKRFVADASHELRTPLTVIRGSATWALQEGRNPAELREALKDTNIAAARMDRLIANLLLLAKSDSSKPSMDTSEVRVDDLLQVVSRQSLDQTELPRIEIDVQPQGLTVMVDFDKMLQILGNLVENSRRHTPATGSIRLVARSIESNVEIEVRDTGSGFASEHLPHVFDRFYRVDDARSADVGGTGLGLALCYELVQLHGGSISIESQVGIGTTVKISLPRNNEELALKTGIQ